MENSDFSYILQNIKPRSSEEREIIKKLVVNLGEFSNVKDVAEYLKLSKSYIYQMIDEKNLIFVRCGRRKIIYTRSLIAILR